MTEKEHKNLMEQIQSGQVKMRPRAYFIVKSSLQVLGLLLFLLLAIFLVSYIFFQLKASGVFGLTDFGLLGVRDLLLSLPWLMLFLVLVFIALLLWFAEHYSIAYKNPLLYSAVGILLIVFVGGYAVAKTPLHPYFFRAFGPPERPAGFMHTFYSRPGLMMMHNGIIGKIEALEDPDFLIRAPDGRPYQIIVSDDTDFVPDDETFDIGDVILVRGKLDDGRAEAWGIRKIMLNEINCGPFCNTK